MGHGSLQSFSPQLKITVGADRPTAHDARAVWALELYGNDDLIWQNSRRQEAVEAAEVVKLVYHGVCLRCHGRQAGVGCRLLLAGDVLDVKSLAPRSECLGNRGLMQSAPVALHQVFI
ncbi:unnamed protein product [Boreogadus saida]